MDIIENQDYFKKFEKVSFADSKEIRKMYNQDWEIFISFKKTPKKTEIVKEKISLEEIEEDDKKYYAVVNENGEPFSDPYTEWPYYSSIEKAIQNFLYLTKNLADIKEVNLREGYIIKEKIIKWPEEIDGTGTAILKNKHRPYTKTDRDVLYFH